MAELEQRLGSLKEEFSELEDGFERYSYLMELGGYLPPYPEEKRTPDHLVRGCQSQVWIHCYTRDGRFFFDADSDTYIIKGVLLLLQDLLSDLPVQEAANANLELIQELGLENEFSDTRQKGLRAAFAMLTNAAKADCALLGANSVSP